MIDSGWILRNQIIWHKPNQMPSSAKDRFTVDFEKIFFFVKQAKGYYPEQQLEPYTKPLDRWAGDKLEATGTNQNGTKELNKQLTGIEICDQMKTAKICVQCGP